MDSDSHPLLTKRMGGALTILVAGTGIGLTLMSFNLRILGMLLSVFCAAGAISIYKGEFERLRFRLIKNGGAQPLYPELWIILTAIIIAVMLPAYVWYDQNRPIGPNVGTARHLSGDQRERMKLALRLESNENYRFQINSTQNCDECELFAEELRDFFNSVPGWKAEGSVLFFSQPFRRGLRLVTRSDEQHIKPVEKISKAFEDAGIALPRETEESEPGGFVIIVARAGT
jgi:hypothetical protein